MQSTPVAADGARPAELRSVKAGEYVKLKADAKTVWKKGAYDRGSHGYELIDTEDISHFRFVRAQKVVFVGFTY